MKSINSYKNVNQNNYLATLSPSCAQNSVTTHQGLCYFLSSYRPSGPQGHYNATKGASHAKKANPP